MAESAVNGIAVTAVAKSIGEEARFYGIQRFEKRIRQSSPWMHGSEMEYIERAFSDGQADMTGEHIEWLEKTAAESIGSGEAVAVSSGNEALRLAIWMAAERIREGSPKESGVTDVGGILSGRHVFCPDFASGVLADIIIQERGVPILIDASADDWCMDPEALATAFERYPEVRLTVAAHVYGFPGRMDEIKRICEVHHARLIEVASETLGARYQNRPCGSFGDYGVLSFGNSQIITGSAGGMLLINDKTKAEEEKRRLEGWSENRIRYERMSNVVAGIIRGQWEHLAEHALAKRRIYERYAKALEALDIRMNPYDEQKAEPNYQISCMTISENSLSEVRWRLRDNVWIYEYDDVHGNTCPPELLEALKVFGVEGQPVWRPLHLQQQYRACEFVAAEEELWDGESGSETETKAYAGEMTEVPCEGEDIFERSLCLPSDVRMTKEEQERVIEIVYACFNGREWRRDWGNQFLF